MSAYRVYRYIAREVTVPAILGLLIFTFVLLMGRILKLVEMVINKGVPFADIALLFACLLPAFLVITIPLAFLLGVLLGFGRLSGDSEIIAMKSSGISLYQMMRPVLAIAFAASLATGALTLFVEPVGNAAFRSQVFQIASSRASVGLLPQVFNDEFDGLVIYAQTIDDRSSTMGGVFISDERVGSSPSVILAQRGRIISDSQALTLTMRLENGAVHRQPKSGGQDAYQVIEFNTYDVNLNMGQELEPTERPKKPKELTLGELNQSIAKIDDPDQRRTLQVELQKRLVLPFAPIIFALVGVPLGIQTQRSGRGGGFAMGLVVFLGYYVMFSFAETLADEGGLPPAVTMWLPNLLFLTGGLYLLRQTALERRLRFFELFTQGPIRLLRQLRIERRRP
ncbi:LPS export ABC transporter permease LptF [Desulfuromonas versatilis]|uniref:LPS export ABC transporter permease LptF n=1 Tax=Desulfuromonas versatilis TaxID=2802975 RepID=A0ABN6E0Y9_9BACT|nr:LPS export ABC transporter permease LptF [Desulfuromonas versatilis]BCR05469.1 LPS export ABC transporter permease LptF [Desulfuromonas versatilis]